MNEDRLVEALERISTNVNDIKVSMAAMQTIVQQHEKRIEKLEDEKPQKNDTFKDEMLRLVAKALIISLTIIGSLTGASAMIKQVLGAAIGN